MRDGKTSDCWSAVVMDIQGDDMTVQWVGDEMSMVRGCGVRSLETKKRVAGQFAVSMRKKRVRHNLKARQHKYWLLALEKQ